METQIEENAEVSASEKVEKMSLNNPDFRNLIVVGAVVLIIALGIVWKKGYFKGSILAGSVSQEQVKEKVSKFVAENLVKEGTKVEVKEISKENGLYKIKIAVQGTEIISYATEDANKFFTGEGVYDMDVTKPEKQPAPKADKPTVDLYVMSFCPFGNKAEDTLKPVYDLLKDKADFNFHYIVSSEGGKITSLHGQPEVDQNIREACVERDYGKDKWFSFVSYVNKNCGEKGECWEAGANSLGINIAKVKSCVSVSGLEIMNANAKASSEAGADGSPTMKINGVSAEAVYQYGNSEEYKKAICDSFNVAPEECLKTLESKTDTSAGASCN